jgi:rhodanese-related sulfurtransferase
MPREIDRAEVTAHLATGAALLDAQGPGKFERQHIVGAIHGRIDDPEATIARLGDDLDREIIVYCTDSACSGSLLAARLLEGCGYRNVLRFTAGIADWVAAGWPVETNAA